MYKHILCAIDGSDTAKRGLHEAIRLTKEFQASLRILHVVDNALLAGSGEVLSDFFEDTRNAGRAILKQAKQDAHDKGVTAETIMEEILDGRVADSIIGQAKAWPADLIVIGTHGRRGVHRMLIGSDAETVVRISPMPVLLVKAN
jgi:nucleotide-binding universal stress UspA family protein